MTYSLGASSALALVIIHVRHLPQKQELPEAYLCCAQLYY
jgi:hypothetical protein